MKHTVAAVVLAAGLSKRMGQAKMLLPWGKSTVLGQVVSAFARAGVDQVIVVAGAERARMEQVISELALKLPVHVVYNPNHESGEMLASLQCGLAALPVQVEAALIGLGDQPQIQPAVARRVVLEFRHMLARIVVPSYRLRRGHPWLLHRSLWPDLALLRSPRTARDFLVEHAKEISYVEVDTPSILQDLDTPEDYRQYRPD